MEQRRVGSGFLNPFWEDAYKGRGLGGEGGGGVLVQVGFFWWISFALI